MKHRRTAIVRARPRYLLDELLADLRSGHNIRTTVYMECGAMYRADGPAAMRCVGETEFVNGIAAMTASGTCVGKRGRGNGVRHYFSTRVAPQVWRGRVERAASACAAKTWVVCVRRP